MTRAAWGFLGLACGFALGDWFAVAAEHDPRRRRLEYLCKPATVGALLGLVATIQPFDDGVRAWFVAALALSLIGDVLLMLPTDHFVDGLVAFLSAHLAYVVGFRLTGGTAEALAVAAVPVAATAVVIGRRILRPVHQGDDAELVGPVAVYMAVISVMVTTALACGRPLAAVGAVLFYGSDALIAWNRFVRPLPSARLAIMVTYHLAQGALALSVLR